ncbi:MAG: N-acetylmuramoyl-L-alanine amidase [Actinomycetota bacterium]|nr:N-acetylmuramoyl-L-alanine amidase [Actinomycetota bacterium]
MASVAKQPPPGPAVPATPFTDAPSNLTPPATALVARPPTTVPPTTVPPTTVPPTTVARSTVPPTTVSANGLLGGKVIAIDPGHNGANFTNPSYINHSIFNGRTAEACDTTGTQTNGGYTEALYNFNVAVALAADLQAEGARVVLTRATNSGVGPCVTDRAAIGNAAHADVAVSIHADGGPPAGRGVAVLLPVADGPNDAIVTPSGRLGAIVRDDFVAGTGMPISSYDGVNGLQPRDDLGGLNLSTVPKVLIECGNMRNGTDAALLVSPGWQARAAAALAAALTAFVLHR